MDFTLHPQLVDDTYTLGDFPLSVLLLSRDANYPWFILVPKRAEISEVFQLSQSDQNQLQQESIALSQALYGAFSADKLNVAALGNVVPQLHVHHIIRYTTDIAWPSPVWGFTQANAYSDEHLKECKSTAIDALAKSDFIPLIDTQK
ncbi:MAG: hypothetical protein A6F71_06490 [Cycloclasticus sp. symbiont of Poecilosclerida sp. M]|nr:MAG: hypothetical protein A6F71_06490 [Cycloclasticus sp. symbiont of Poecilosclerida sp. M]